MSRLPLWSIALALTVAGCGGGSSAPKESGSAPKTTQRVYLATAMGCSNPAGDDVHFTPLRVAGPGYETTVEPVQGCEEQRIFNSYVYDVPTPASGTVSVTPGNAPSASLDAAKLSASHAATVYYARESDDRYKVTVIEYEKTDDVQNAA